MTLMIEDEIWDGLMQLLCVMRETGSLDGILRSDWLRHLFTTGLPT